jgi:hypothetical protein
MRAVTCPWLRVFGNVSFITGLSLENPLDSIPGLCYRLAACRTIHEPAANPAVWLIFQLLFGP